MDSYRIGIDSHPIHHFDICLKEENMLEGKVAFITGSSRGIGKEIARLFLDNKAKVVICGSKLENAEKLENEFREEGYSKNAMMAVGINMTDNTSIQEAVQKTIANWGKIDILVNNAGITSHESLLDSKDEDFEKMFDVNVFGVVKVTREVVKYMKETGGSIINTSSMVGIYGGKNQSAYSASKFAVNGLTISWAKELGSYNIRVNAVAPGVVETDMMKGSVNDKMKEMLVQMTPLHTMAQPSDLAGAYLYLASDAAKFTTGTIIKVDGGLTM